MTKHLLLIDDDKDELDILNAALEYFPVTSRCTWAKSAEQALQMLQHLRPDCILIDMNMPRANGLECLYSIKQMDALKDIPAFIYSTYIDEHIILQARSMGAFGCIRKPGHTSSIPDVVQQIFSCMQV